MDRREPRPSRRERERELRRHRLVEQGRRACADVQRRVPTGARPGIRRRALPRTAPGSTDATAPVCIRQPPSDVRPRRRPRRRPAGGEHTHNEATDWPTGFGSDGNHIWTAFGPTNVKIHQTCLAVEFGDVQRAMKSGLHSTHGPCRSSGKSGTRSKSREPMRGGIALTRPWIHCSRPSRLHRIRFAITAYRG